MIPLFKSFCSTKETIENLRDVIASGYMSEGPVVKRFEKALAALYGIDEIMCTNSCTSALQIAFRCIDIQPGDEVISTPLTCVATNMPLYQMGARIIWADVDSISGMVSASQVERLITSKTKAIVILHKEGDVFERSKIKKLAYFHNLPVVEDCAHILNSTEANIQVPEDADFACFSYQAIKHLNTGDGGALYCAPKYRNLARKFKWFGIDRNMRESGKWLEDITVDGYKMNMNDVTASIGLAQLQTMEDKWHTNYLNGSCLDSIFLDKVPFVMTSFDRKVNKSSYWAYPIRVGNRSYLIEKLSEVGIASRQIHPRNDTLSIFKKFATQDLPNVCSFDQSELCLPVGWWVDSDALDLISSTVIKHARPVNA